MVHNTADKVAEARLAAITHEVMKEKIVPKDYTKRHGMDYDLIDYRVDQMIRMFGEPDDYSKTRTDPESGRRFMGYAIWRYPTPKMEGVPQMPFLKKIFIKDHLLLANDHIDFLFTKTDIAWHDTGTLEKANMISESIRINDRYETCTSSCHFLTGNLVSHYLTWRVAMGVISELKARKAYKTLIKAGKAELEKASSLGEELRMPVHSTLIDYLNTMYNGYARDSEVAEEIITQGLEALDEATGGDFLYQTPEELASAISNRQKSASRSTSVGTVTVTTRPKTVPKTTMALALKSSRAIKSVPAAEKIGLDDYLDDEYHHETGGEKEREFSKPARSQQPRRKIYM